MQGEKLGTSTGVIQQQGYNETVFNSDVTNEGAKVRGGEQKTQLMEKSHTNEKQLNIVIDVRHVYITDNKHSAGINNSNN